MAAAYELFLRARAGATLDADALAAALAGLEPGLRAEPYRPDPAVEAGAAAAPAPRGVDLGLDDGGTIDQLLDAAFRLAAALDLEVFDPQVGETVTAAGRERIAARHAELCSYRADTLGEVGTVPLPSLAAPGPATRTRLHLWLIVAGLVVAFLLVARGCRWLL